ncbi:hypothetical protein NON00_01840 [Roseomonas sp. GC11]|uniref:hypothetical protein n=1 Tax=Roseomonas sp. GC11 TaxID=2950546 RepID=UPI0021089F95|nr:hypothetical protein [Roseomonas sp. GC11]MCQ4158671.1 hypothetical protein [Roseomonas sp. GC11]
MPASLKAAHQEGGSGASWHKMNSMSSFRQGTSIPAAGGQKQHFLIVMLDNALSSDV